MFTHLRVTHVVEERAAIALKEQSGGVDDPYIIRWTISLSACCPALLVRALEGGVAQASAAACGPLRPIIRIAIDRYFLESFARLLIVIAFSLRGARSLGCTSPRVSLA